MPDQAILHVSYRGNGRDRFDRGYYVEHHLPLVRAAFGRYGLIDLAAFFPAGDVFATVALCECRFRDRAAIEAAFSSPEAALVMADVPNFTDLAAERTLAVPFDEGRLA